MLIPRRKNFRGIWSHIATVCKKLFLKAHLWVKVSFSKNPTFCWFPCFLKTVAMWLQMPRKFFLRGISTYSNTFSHCLRPRLCKKSYCVFIRYVLIDICKEINRKLNFYKFNVENWPGFCEDFWNFVFSEWSKFEPICKKIGASYKKTKGSSRGYHSMVYPEQKELQR